MTALQAWIQYGGHRQSPAPSHSLQAPHTRAAEPGSWTLLGKMLWGRSDGEAWRRSALSQRGW